jgi:hypothetical protein
MESNKTPLIKVTTAESNYVSGSVEQALYCSDDYKVVVYAKTDIWYVQPFTTAPLTTIERETCSWETLTHAWDELAVFLVPKNYNPPTTLPSQSCPPNLPGVGIIASDCYRP